MGSQNDGLWKRYLQFSKHFDVWTHHLGQTLHRGRFTTQFTSWLSVVSLSTCFTSSLTDNYIYIYIRSMLRQQWSRHQPDSPFSRPFHCWYLQFLCKNVGKYAKNQSEETIPTECIEGLRFKIGAVFRVGSWIYSFHQKNLGLKKHGSSVLACV